MATLVSPDGSLPQQYLSNYATLQLLDRLDGSMSRWRAPVCGARLQYAPLIDPGRAAEVNLTVDEVVAAVTAQNAQVAAGAVGQPPFNKGGTAFQLGIQAKGRLQTPEISATSSSRRTIRAG